MSLKNAKIAILHTFSRNDSTSIGALVIKDELERKGYHVDFCDYSSAFNYTHVLVSMTSTDDIFHIYAGCKKNNWQNRTFKALVGGFGCQNPIALSDYIDYAFFGRTDGIIEDVLINHLKFKEHLFKISKPHMVSIRQVSECYPNSIKHNGAKWREKSIGCPVKCKFCSFSHTRDWVKGEYETFEWLLKGRTQEVLIKDIPEKVIKKQGWVKSAIDGYSERLRFKYGKKFATWENIENALDHLCTFKGTTKLQLYNIHNFPTETKEDIIEFFDFFNNYVEDAYKGDGKLIVEIHNTPFRPTLCTPMERQGAKLFPAAKPQVGLLNNYFNYLPVKPNSLTIASKNNIHVKFSVFIENPFKHLKGLISIRYSDKDIIEEILRIESMSGVKALDYCIKNIDITPYIREYKENEDLKFKWIK